MKILIIKKSAEFQEIGKNCAKFHAKSLLLLERKTPEKFLCDKKQGKNAIDFCRLGLTVSKKVGGAITRNLVKRRLRHAARGLFKDYAKNHHDYVIIAKSDIAKADFKQILQDLQFCLQRIGKG